jgi:hypothetical protein
MNIAKNLPKKIAFYNYPYAIKGAEASWGVFCG